VHQTRFNKELWSSIMFGR